MINWLEEFEKFLMDNDCYSQFTTELLESGKTLYEYIESRLQDYKDPKDFKYGLYYLVSEAFVWDDYINWNSIHTKWYKYVKSRLG